MIRGGSNRSKRRNVLGGLVKIGSGKIGGNGRGNNGVINKNKWDKLFEWGGIK